MAVSTNTCRRTEINSSEIKATTGLTYDNFSVSLDNLIRPNDNTKLGHERFKRIMDTLYNAVRLRQWQHTTVNAPAEAAYLIWNLKETTKVIVTMKTVEITRGLRQFQVAEGLDAAALFNGIKHAQDIIKLSVNAVDNTDDAEFFKPLSEEEQSAQMDAVLSDEENDREHLTGVQAAQVVQAAVEKADTKLQRPAMDREHVTKRLKSLQGRVLTIVEAILADKQQREAVKTLMNKEFRREIEKAICFFELPGEGHSSEDSDEE